MQRPSSIIKQGPSLLISFERIDTNQIRIITFYFNANSTPASKTAASNRRFRKQFSIDINWQTRNNIHYEKRAI